MPRRDGMTDPFLVELDNQHEGGYGDDGGGANPYATPDYAQRIDPQPTPLGPGDGSGMTRRQQRLSERNPMAQPAGKTPRMGRGNDEDAIWGYIERGGPLDDKLLPLAEQLRTYTNAFPRSGYSSYGSGGLFGTIHTPNLHDLYRVVQGRKGNPSIAVDTRYLTGYRRPWIDTTTAEWLPRDLHRLLTVS